MKLPAADHLLVEREKIVDYLLSATHRYGAGKARFFMAYGFRVEEWEVFRAALQEHGQRCPVTRITETGFGPHYEVEGALSTPDGRGPRIYTVWQLDLGQTVPRLHAQGAAYEVEFATLTGKTLANGQAALAWALEAKATGVTATVYGAGTRNVYVRAVEDMAYGTG